MSFEKLNEILVRMKLNELDEIELMEVAIAIMQIVQNKLLDNEEFYEEK